MHCAAMHYPSGVEVQVVVVAHVEDQDAFIGDWNTLTEDHSIFENIGMHL